MKWRELYSTSVSQVLQELVPEPPVATGRVIKQPYFLAIVKFFWVVLFFLYFVCMAKGIMHITLLTRESVSGIVKTFNIL